MSKLIFATEQGIILFARKNDGRSESLREMADQQVTCVTARNGVILAGTTNGVFRSQDEGHSWDEVSTGLTTQHIRWVAFHPDTSDLVLAGTEPANIFVSRDGGSSWRFCPEVAQLRDRFKWSLPYSPEAGCVRGFAFHGSRLYAAVEVGGILISDDSGDTWNLAEGSDGKPGFAGPPEPFVHPDVHSLAVHPSSQDLVYAPTGGGFYRSRDGGNTWKRFYDCYCRAVWVDPQNPDHMILGPADGVDRNGRIEESRDGGETWSMASNGLQVPWRRGMVERFFEAVDELFAVLSSGEVLSTSLSTLEWKRTFPNINNVNAIAQLV
ncbi:MAG TPA: hypothetical protein VJ830_01235 [Anaerolineales bacterium]|nr:hypothetical protein [Anaerolineales bacterium]